MLDKIQNISPSGSFDGGSKNPGGSLRGFTKKVLPSRDIAAISETAKFLSLIKWKLLSLNLISSNLLHMSFQFGNLEISLSINSEKFLNEPRLEFAAAKTFEQTNFVKKKIIFSFRKSKYVRLAEVLDLQFTSLDQIFDKALRLNMLELDSQPAEYEQSVLFEDLLLKLESEFDYFFKRLCELINLLGFMQIPENYEFPKDNLQPFLIQKIIANL